MTDQTDDLTLEELEALTNPDNDKTTETSGEVGVDEPLAQSTGEGGETDSITEIIPPVEIPESTPDTGSDTDTGTEPTPDVIPDPLPEVEPPQQPSQYLDYDQMNFLGEVFERNGAGGDAPGIVVTGPIGHIRIKEKLNELMDLVHPKTAYTITTERTIRSSRVVTEILHMCFNAPMRDEINNNGANFQNSFQLFLEAMAHPLIRPAFDRRRIFSYTDPLLKDFPTLISYMLKMTEKQTHDPVLWREEAKKLQMSFTLLARRWPRNHLPKYENFCMCWIA